GTAAGGAGAGVAGGGGGAGNPLPASVYAAERLPSPREVEAWSAEARLREVRCSPFGAAAPALRLELPAEWSWTMSEADPRPTFPKWQRLASARGGADVADVGVSVVVRATQLEREVALFEVMLRETEARQMAILDRSGPPRFGGSACMDLICRTRPGGRPTLTRMRAYKDGAYVYLLEISAPEAVYAARREVLEQVAARAGVVNPTARPYAEELTVVTVPGVAGLSTSVPASFRVAPGRGATAAGEAPTAVPLRLAAPGDPRYAGTLEIAGLDREENPSHTVEVLLYQEMEKLGRTGAEIEDLRAERDTLPTSRFPGPGKFCVFACTKEGVECEAVVLIRSSERSWVVLTLFGPTRREAPELWMANRRAFDLADFLMREQ
ncbi:MAG: hypothetical protein HZA54_17715, partial [Planctomycetes bacterium]|nr:hypothetical protein [Planctomycetota bacterium]